MMKRYYIHHAYQLQSHPQKVLLRPGQYFTTESEEEIAELEALKAERGCEEIASMKKPALRKTGTKSSTKGNEPNDPPPPPAGNPNEDITVVPGVGAKLKAKLEAEGITTKTQLAALIKSDEAKAKDLLGTHFEKAKEFLLSE